MRLLIVSTYFPPQNSIASLRPYSWAKWWSRMGHDVTVLTTPKRPHPDDLRLSHVGFRVVKLPIPLLGAARSTLRMLESASRRRASSPMSVSAEELDGVESSGHIGTSGIGTGLHWLTERYGVLGSCRFPDHHDLWAARAARWARATSWDAVITSGGPYSVHRVGAAVKRTQSSTSWLLDWRDLWTENHIFPGLAPLRPYERWLEARFHAAADAVTTVSEPLAKTLRGITSTSVHVIYNGFEEEDYEALSPEPFFSGDTVNVSYTGTLYPHYQNLRPLFDAVHRLERDGLIGGSDLRLNFAGACEQVVGIARERGVERYVKYFGRLPREDALRMQRDSDALLFVGREGERPDGVLTGKLFEYVASGTPVLAMGVSPHGSAAEVLETAGVRVVYLAPPESIAERIASFLAASEAPATGHTADARGRNGGCLGALTRRAQAEALLDLVRSLRVAR
jgi:glycosyltransferase involved in cell wall biosynthesis